MHQALAVHGTGKPKESSMALRSGSTACTAVVGSRAFVIGLLWPQRGFRNQASMATRLSLVAGFPKTLDHRLMQKCLRHNLRRPYALCRAHATVRMQRLTEALGTVLFVNTSVKTAYEPKKKRRPLQKKVNVNVYAVGKNSPTEFTSNLRRFY